MISRATTRRLLKGYQEAAATAAEERGDEPKWVKPEHLEYQATRAADLARDFLGKPGPSVILGDPVGTGKTEVALATAMNLLLTGTGMALERVVIVAPNITVAGLWFKRAGEMWPGASDVIVDHWRTGKMPRRRPGGDRRMIVTTRRRCPGSMAGDPATRLVIVDEAHRGAEAADPDDPETFFGRLGSLCRGARVLLVTATPFQISARGFYKLLDVTGGGADIEPVKRYTAAARDLRKTWSKLIPSERQATETADIGEVPPALRRALHELGSAWEGYITIIQRHRLEFSRGDLGVPGARFPEDDPVPLGSWALGYQVAGVVPALLGAGGGAGDMFQRRLVSSSEAFFGGTAGQALHKRQSPVMRDLRRQLDDRLGTGTTHPKVSATVREAARRWRDGQHVLIFCVFRATQIALRDAIIAKVNEDRDVVIAPRDALPEDTVKRFRRRAAGEKPLILVLTDQLSESIDLDGGGPCLIHHDLPWNPARIVQRWGRVVRISSGFATPDVVVPVLDCPVDRRLFVTLRDRLSLAEDVAEGADRRHPLLPPGLLPAKDDEGEDHSGAIHRLLATVTGASRSRSGDD